MTINSILKTANTKRNQPQHRLTTRFHVFYEGEVTERQLIKALQDDLDANPGFVNIYEMKVAKDNHQS